jgi:hypothetical protein
VRIEEQELGGLRWLVARGARDDVFASLGEYMRAETHAIVADAGTERLRRHAAANRELIATVTQASVTAFPGAWAELAAMAKGAGVPAADLALLNLRGDLGSFAVGAAGESVGCSDLAWHETRSFIAHNEDEPASYHGRCALLTLDIDEQRPVTAFWVPGFLPANTFAVTGTSMVISIDHLPVAVPARAAGRAFVARGLQQAASTVDDALAFLRDHPSAGGYSYTIGDGTGRIVIIESAAGQCAWREVGTDGPLAWHTNHGRYVETAGTNPRGSSLRRGQVLAALAEPGTEPDHGWFLDVLAGAPLPRGVRADPSGDSIASTLCTFVAELTSGQLVMQDRNSAPATISLPDLAAGRLRSRQ